MSHLHFTSTEAYRNRVIQLGENPERVFNVGALGIDNIKYIKLFDRNDLENNLNFRFGNKCVLVTYHPVTLDNNSAGEQMQNLLDALEAVKELRIIFTLPNSDTNGRIIIDMINAFVKNNSDRTTAFSDLGQVRYLSLLKFVDVVVGNSSSGIIEAPSFGIPTLNIGDRQKGRLRADTVVDCDPEFKDIHENLLLMLSEKEKYGFPPVENPYFKDNTAGLILDILKKTSFNNIFKKGFYDL